MQGLTCEATSWVEERMEEDIKRGADRRHWGDRGLEEQPLEAMSFSPIRTTKCDFSKDSERGHMETQM